MILKPQRFYLFLTLIIITGCQSSPTSTYSSTTGETILPSTGTVDQVFVPYPIDSSETMADEDTLSSGPSGSTTDCSNRASFVDDVTIRDSTLIAPGDGFVKIWRLRNVGSCTWTKAYSLYFFGGDRMEAPHHIQLPTNVNPGQSIDLVIDLTAPVGAGAYQGFWRLQPEAGQSFGIGPNAEQSFWVKIQVSPTLGTSVALAPTLGAIPSSTPAETAASTSTTSPSPTPVVYAMGHQLLEIGHGFNLDMDTPSTVENIDINLDESNSGNLVLSPSNGSLLGEVANDPIEANPLLCNTLSLNSTPLLIERTSEDELICYRTSDGRLGYFRIRSINGSISIDFVTWTS